MLKQFRALPTEGRARAMKDRDYLWCLANALLDGEEELERLCPRCRSRAEEARCPASGRPTGEWGEGGGNASFDPERYERMKRGEPG